MRMPVIIYPFRPIPMFDSDLKRTVIRVPDRFREYDARISGRQVVKGVKSGNYCTIIIVCESLHAGGIPLRSIPSFTPYFIREGIIPVAGKPPSVLVP